MRISSKAHYGLQAAFILAKRDATISAKELEKEIGVSCKYLERIMRILSCAGVVKASRGTQGGYYLAKEPCKTSAGEIVRALENDLKIIECVSDSCSANCASSMVWKKLYKGINEILDNISLEDMIVEDNKKNGQEKHVDVMSACENCMMKCNGNCFAVKD